MPIIQKLLPYALAALLPTAALAAPQASPSNSNWLVSQSTQCMAAIKQVEIADHLPHGLLTSIAKVESGRPISGIGDIRPWPWTIDADGQALFLDSKAASVAWVAMAQKRGARFIDVGCMQVDLRLHPEAFANLDDAFDPLKNVDYAARYLLALHREAGGDWGVAVGLYHSHTPALAAAYRDRVAAVGNGIISGVGNTEPLYVRAMRQGTLHLALAGGGMIAIHIRQPASHRRPITSCKEAATLNPLLRHPIRARC